MPAALAFLRRIVGLVRLGAPPRLTLLVWRWIVRFLAREFAFQYMAVAAILVAAIVLLGWADETLGIAAIVLLGLWFALEARFAWLSWRTTRAIEAELREEIPGDPPESRFPKSHLWFPLLMLFARSVSVERGVVFHREERRRVRLDIYRPRAGVPDGERLPAVIQVHGGGWILGSRSEQGIPLLNHMAANGWIGFNVDYRLSPRATLPEHVVDVKRAIAWVREHADELGVDPRRIAITGGSAGGHLTALAALTADDPSLQPGFESADTSVMAAVPFYGIYDLHDEARRYPQYHDWLFAKVVLKQHVDGAPELYRSVSPSHRVTDKAPPFLIFHGDQDTLVPVDDARDFARRLEETSRNRVLYVEMPGAEHAFDIFPSLRTARVVECIERFLRLEASE
ncbi:MAG: alpha/beta hydrolase [Actinomycetota bacterium]|nr:alpha/beta hydrolase [Actinomycetota bacterium]